MVLMLCQWGKFCSIELSILRYDVFANSNESVSALNGEEHFCYFASLNTSMLKRPTKQQIANP